MAVHSNRTIVSVGLSAYSLNFNGATLINNSGFESGASGYPTDWTHIGTAGSSSWSTQRFYKGSRSIRLSDPATNTNSGARSIATAVTHGQIVTATGWSYNESGTSWLYINFYNSSGARIDIGEYRVQFTATGIWDSKVLSVVAPQGTATARAAVYCDYTNQGVAFFDDVRLFIE